MGRRFGEFQLGPLGTLVWLQGHRILRHMVALVAPD